MSDDLLGKWPQKFVQNAGTGMHLEDHTQHSSNIKIALGDVLEMFGNLFPGGFPYINDQGFLIWG